MNCSFLNCPHCGLSLQYVPPNHAENIFIIHLYNSFCALCCHSLGSDNHYTDVINKRTTIILFSTYSIPSENKLKPGFVWLECDWTPDPKSTIVALNITYLLSKVFFLNLDFVLFLMIHLSLQTQEQWNNSDLQPQAARSVLCFHGNTCWMRQNQA